MDDIKKAIQNARTERMNHIQGCFSNSAELNESSEDIRKADDEQMVENDENSSNEEETEKSDIMYAINDKGDIKVSKSGKEIKEQVDNVVLPELNANLAVKEAEAMEKLKNCGQAPTKDPDDWWTGDVKMGVGYKVYSWDEQEFCQNNNRVYPTLSASDEQEKKGNCPTSAAEAKARQEYNDIVRSICNIKVDIKACEILKNLQDNHQYELTPRQVIALKF